MYIYNKIHINLNDKHTQKTQLIINLNYYITFTFAFIC